MSLYYQYARRSTDILSSYYPSLSSNNLLRQTITLNPSNLYSQLICCYQNFSFWTLAISAQFKHFFMKLYFGILISIDLVFIYFPTVQSIEQLVTSFIQRDYNYRVLYIIVLFTLCIFNMIMYPKVVYLSP